MNNKANIYMEAIDRCYSAPFMDVLIIRCTGAYLQIGSSTKGDDNPGGGASDFDFTEG